MRILTVTVFVTLLFINVFSAGAGEPKLQLQPKTYTAADGTEIQGEFGQLQVPENRDNPQSRAIELAFVRLHATTKQPKAPLVYLAGGPGGSSTWFAEDARSLQNWVPVLQISDVIFLDQRATGKSTPNLSYESDAQAPRNAFTDRDAIKKGYLELLRTAADHFRAQGYDLDGYNSVQSADDINDLRLALGLDKISLLGFSYGSHLALATIRRHGEHLENVITIGVEGLHQTHKLPFNMDTQWGKLGILVANDENVGAAVPDMTELLLRVYAKLDREPMVVPVCDRREKQVIRVPIGTDGLKFILRLDLGDASDLPVFPRLLYTIDQGDPSVLQWFAQKRWGFSGSVNLMGALVDGASGASPERWALIAAQDERSLFSGAANFLWPEIDAATGVKDLGEDYRAPLVSDVRALFITGTLDFNTPPHQAEEVRWGMPNATHLVVENVGHEQIITQPEVQRTMARFLVGEDVRDVTIVKPRLRFIPVEGYDTEVFHPSAGVAQQFRYALMSDGLDAAMAHHKDLKARFDVDTEREMNKLGHEMRRNGFTDVALAIMQLNADEYPQSWRAWDGLAEMHGKAGNRETSIELYQKSLAMNPDNENAVRKLEEMGVKPAATTQR